MRLAISRAVRSALVWALVAGGAFPFVARADDRILEVDAIGPRRGAAVRSALRGRLPSLAPCRGPEAQLVRIGFAIGPTGAVIDARAIDDPDLDPEATACVIAELRSWRFPGRAGSTTTVSWSFTLGPAIANERTCWCFGWVHGPDHGNSCEPTRRQCLAEQRRMQRDASPCAERRLPSCEDTASIGDAH